MDIPITEIDEYLRDIVDGIEARVLLYMDGAVDMEKYNYYIRKGLGFSETIYMGEFTTQAPDKIPAGYRGAVGFALLCMDDGPETVTVFSETDKKPEFSSTFLIHKHPEKEMYKLTYLINFRNSLQPVGHIAYVGKTEDLADLLD